MILPVFRPVARRLRAALAVGLLFGGFAGDAAATGGISGRVTGPDSEPLPDVEVHAFVVPFNAWSRDMFLPFQFKGGFAAWAQTGADGRYQLTGLEPTLPQRCEEFNGQYVLLFSPPRETGFAPKFNRHREGIPSLSMNRYALTVEEGKTLAGIDARLGPPARISGTVTGPDGAPLVGALVEAVTNVFPLSEDVLRRTFTDGRGRYVLTGLEDEDYYVRVTPPGVSGPVFHPGTADPAPIRPELGRTLGGYDVVVLEPGKITVNGSAPSFGVWGFTSRLEEMYDWRVPFPPGNYRVAIWQDSPSAWLYYPGTFQEEDATPVVVRSGETTSINLSPAPPGMAAGRVVDGEGAPVDSVTVTVTREYSCGPDGGTSTNASGDFTVASGGDRKISFSKEGFFPTWLYDKPDEGSADFVHFRSGETLTLPDVVLVSRGAPGSIAGRVTAAGTPIVGARVEIWSSPIGAAALQSVTPDADGAYETAALSPGSYLVRFTDATPGSAFGEQWYPGAVSSATAQAVTVDPGLQTGGIDADLGAKGSIAGRVTRDQATAPSPVSVCLADLSGSPLRCVFTSPADGSYRFEGVAPGRYLVAFDRMQQYSWGRWYPNQASMATAEPIVVAPGAAVTNIDVDFPLPGRFSGKIISPKEDEGCNLALVDADSGVVLAYGWLSTGPYSLGIYPGRYHLLFSTPLMNYHPQWYPGKHLASEAEIIEILPGQTLSGVDTLLEYWGDNRPPALEHPGDLAATEGLESSFTLAADDPDGDLLTFGAEDLPPGATFDPYSGAFQWTPSCSQAGAYPAVRFTVTDHGDPPLSAEVTVAVNVAGRACLPLLDPIGNQTVIAGEPLTFKISATNPESGPLALEATGLPTGAAFDAADGTFSWTPGIAQSGAHDVTFAAFASDDPSLRDEETITISVLERAPPALDPIGNRSVIVGEPLTFRITASEPLGDPITLEATGLPGGATFSPDDGTFTWTPEGTQGGVHLVTFAALFAGDRSLRDEEVVAITALGPLLFRDDFSHDDQPADPDWITVAGVWSVRDGAFRSKATGKAIAVTGPGNLAGSGFTAGRIESRIMLGPLADRMPNLTYIFGYRDPQHYRYVRFLPDATEIGQVGEIDGQPATRVRKPSGLVAGRWQRARVDVHPTGVVRAYGGDLLLGTLKFPAAVPGNVGVMTRNSRSFVDDYRLRAKTVLP